MIVVADASAVASFLLPDEAGRFASFARRICADEPLLLPPHWRVEMASILWKARRRKRLTQEDARVVASQAEAIAMTANIGPPEAVEYVLAFASGRGLTAYDSLDLILALRFDAALLSADKALCAAAAGDNGLVLTP